MSKDVRRDANTVPLSITPSPASTRPQGFRLLIIGETGATTHPLPDSGTVVVGRGVEAEVRIDSAAVSRRHAEIALGPPLRVRDLGSSNGTTVRGRRLGPDEWGEVAIGEPVELGDLTLVVQRRTAPAPSGRPRQVWSHGYFEARVEEECARAGRAPFSLLRVCLLEPGRDEQAREALAAAIGPMDLLATYGPGQFELLLLECGEERAHEVETALAEELSRHGLTYRMARADHPEDGRSAQALIAHVGAALTDEEPPANMEEGIVLQEPAMVRLFAVLKRVAASPLSVLLLGESGVGKEVFAEAIHRHSPRAQQPFVRLNCATFSETLLESELFGHERGAFTGAVKAKQGLLESASGGTVFLDEVGELPLGLQAKLLRVIEQREVQRLGELRPRPIDVRFVAATNRDLEAEVARGTFRSDLFFRLNGVSLAIPPLRERTSEIDRLARNFLEQAARKMGVAAPALTEEALRLLRAYRWPGNVRELKNVMERAVVLCTGDRILPEHLPLEKLSAAIVFPSAPPPPLTVTVEKQGTRKPGGDRDAILAALQRYGGNQTEAARELGITRKTLMAWMDAHGIPRPRKG